MIVTAALLLPLFSRLIAAQEDIMSIQTNTSLASSVEGRVSVQTHTTISAVPTFDTITLPTHPGIEESPSINPDLSVLKADDCSRNGIQCSSSSSLRAPLILRFLAMAGSARAWDLLPKRQGFIAATLPLGPTTTAAESEKAAAAIIEEDDVSIKAGHCDFNGFECSSSSSLRGPLFFRWLALAGSARAWNVPFLKRQNLDVDAATTLLGHPFATTPTQPARTNAEGAGNIQAVPGGNSPLLPTTTVPLSLASFPDRAITFSPDPPITAQKQNPVVGPAGPFYPTPGVLDADRGPQQRTWIQCYDPPVKPCVTLVGVEGGSNNGIILGGLPSSGNKLDVGRIFGFDFWAGVFVWTLVVLLLLVAVAAEVVRMWRVASAAGERRRGDGEIGTGREERSGEGSEESIGDDDETTPLLPASDSSSRDDRIASGAFSILAPAPPPSPPFAPKPDIILATNSSETPRGRSRTKK